jgi:hypothetical protein
VRRRIASKPDTYTESMDVYVAGISGKVSAHYPGRSQSLPECYYRHEVMGRTLRSQQRA